MHVKLIIRMAFNKSALHMHARCIQIQCTPFVLDKDYEQDSHYTGQPVALNSEMLQISISLILNSYFF